MKRRLFAFLPFVGAAWGQQSGVDMTGVIMQLSYRCGYCGKDFTSEAELDAHECTFHVKNGRCPVCGQMAKPWKVQKSPGVLTNCHPAKNNDILIECSFGPDEYGPTSRQERCSRCNASFWTDGEKD